MEIKPWKRKKAVMFPLQFKELIEENHRLKNNNRERTGGIRISKEVLKGLIKLKMNLPPRSREQRIHEEARSQADPYSHWAQEPDWI